MKNSYALITGASGSIGQAISETLHAAGVHVILSGTNEKKLLAVKDKLKENCSVKPCDLSSTKAIQAMIDEIKQELKQDNMAIKANAINKLCYVSFV